MITSPTKKVSVIIPNYNYGQYIKKRIKSILKQTYPIYELIILDDNSTDNSIKVIESQIKEIKKIKPDLKICFIKNDKNSGKAMKQWKKGFELAKGDFIWIAEADDLSNKKFLEEVMKGFRDENVLISYTESKIINKNGFMIAPNFRWSRDKEKTDHFKKSYIKDGKKEIQEIMAIRCTIPNVSSAVFQNNKTIPYDKYLTESLDFIQVGDWYFYVKILENGKISYNKKALNKFRVHGDSVTNNSKKNQENLKEVKWIHEFFKKNFDLNKRTLKYMKNEENRIKNKYGIIETDK